MSLRPPRLLPVQLSAQPRPPHCQQVRLRPVTVALSLAITGLAGLDCAVAQTSVSPAQGPDPERVVVTGSREPVAAGRLVGDLLLIDEEQIRDSAADSLEDLLRREAGLQVSRSGGPGSNAAVFIRGLAASGTLVLVDGVRIGSATLGQVALEGLSLAGVERIEVLRGPGSSLYGADGAGGVVQIFTRRGQSQPQGGAHLALGQHGGLQASTDAAARFGALDLAATVAHERLDGVSALRPGDRFANYNPDRDGFERDSAQLQLGWRPVAGHRLALSASRSRLNAQFDGSEYLPPDYAPDPSADFRNRLINELAVLEHRAEWSPAWSSTLRLSTQEDDLHSGGRQVDHYRTRREVAEAQLSWRPAAGQRLTLAYEGQREQGRSSAYLADAERDNDAAVLAWQGRLGAFDTQVEWRHDDNSAYGQVNTGRLGAAWRLDDGWRLRALAGSSFRAPSFNDLYYPGYGVPPDADPAHRLRPERGRSVELGLQRRWDVHQVSATWWRNRMRDLIGYQPDRSACPADPAYDYGCAANVARAELQGLSLDAGTRWQAWQLRAQVDFTAAHDAISGARLPRRAAHQASLDATYSWGDWRLGATVLQVGARPEGGQTLPQETTLDLQARWLFRPGWTAEARLLNVTDVDQQPALDYQGLGRQLWLGLRYRFGSV